MANWHLATYQDNLFKNNLGIINLDNTLEKYVYKLQDPIDDSITSVNENNWLRIDITHADKTVSDWVTTNSTWTEDTNITGLVNGSVYWVYGAPYSYYTIIADGKSYGLQSVSNTDGKITGKDINDSDVSIDIKTITKVIIGDLVTEIGYSAFAGCSSLTSVTIPDSVETIGVGAFAICSKLASVTIGDSVTTIPQGAFSECSSLVSLTIPDSVTEIGFGAFFLCSSLVSLIIPASVTEIGQLAFYKCYSLASLTFEENSELQTIGESAFSRCFSLASVTIPDSVTSIRDDAFELCIKLASLTFEENSKLDTIGESAFSGINSSNSPTEAIITIPQTVLTNLNTKYDTTLSHNTGQSFFGASVTLQDPASS